MQPCFFFWTQNILSHLTFICSIYKSILFFCLTFVLFFWMQQHLGTIFLFACGYHFFVLLNAMLVFFFWQKFLEILWNAHPSTLFNPTGFLGTRFRSLLLKIERGFKEFFWLQAGCIFWIQFFPSSRMQMLFLKTWLKFWVCRILETQSFSLENSLPQGLLHARTFFPAVQGIGNF